jgi:hypothetical protein
MNLKIHSVAIALRSHLKLGLGIAALVGIFAAVAISFYRIATDMMAFIMDSFLLKFLILTVAYILLFAISTAFVVWIWQKLDEQSPKITFRMALGGVSRALRLNNNRRWEYLVAMTVITFVIACARPGAPLLVSGARHLPNAVLSDAALDRITIGWDYFLHGNNPSPPREIPTPREATWFWWWAFFLYLPSTFVYFFFAFWDEFSEGMKRAGEAFSKYREKAQQARQAAGAPQPSSPTQTQTIPPSATPAQRPWWSDFLRYGAMDIIYEGIFTILKEFGVGFMEVRRTKRERRPAWDS